MGGGGVGAGERGGREICCGLLKKEISGLNRAVEISGWRYGGGAGR